MEAVTARSQGHQQPVAPARRAAAHDDAFDYRLAVGRKRGQRQDRHGRGLAQPHVEEVRADQKLLRTVLERKRVRDPTMGEVEDGQRRAAAVEDEEPPPARCHRKPVGGDAEG